MYVRFWGTRGSIATPGPDTIRYGGNTACVEARADDGTRLILDCGTGARELGLHLLSAVPRPMCLHLLIGHTHWDHIQGFPFFDPAFLPDTELHIYAPRGFQHSLEDALAGQMQYPYFPVTFQDLRSRIHLTELAEGFFRIGEVLVETQYLNHTAPTLAYRLSDRGATVAYVTDHEPFWNPADAAFQHPGDQRHIDFLRGADLVIHDAQYTQEEYRSKIGWGHSTIEYATDMALAAGVARLALFHHDPSHDDRTMVQLAAAAQARVAARGGGLDVFAAAEKCALEVCGTGEATAIAATSALRYRSIAGRCVMVVSADEAQAAAMRQTLSEDDLVVLHTADWRTTLAQAPTAAPDLVIINQPLPDGDGAALIQPLRACLGCDTVPIILLTDRPHDVAPAFRDRPVPTDYLAAPVSLPMLHTRVRAWLMRTLMQSPSGPPGQLQRLHGAPI
jgi:phosphoribosyl 1,2-cyclic phosphodiesterase/CheY-like chemotaxis protein